MCIVVYMIQHNNYCVYVIKVVIVQCGDTESVSVHCVLLVSVCVTGDQCVCYW